MTEESHTAHSEPVEESEPFVNVILKEQVTEESHTAHSEPVEESEPSVNVILKEQSD